MHDREKEPIEYSRPKTKGGSGLLEGGALIMERYNCIYKFPNLLQTRWSTVPLQTFSNLLSPTGSFSESFGENGIKTRRICQREGQKNNQPS